MATNDFDEVLARARELGVEDQHRLVRELTKPTAPENGAPVRSLYDALKERGIIGCITDGPSDLSTNPKYMEGFGQHAE